jgi:hypothetical protein
VDRLQIVVVLVVFAVGAPFVRIRVGRLVVMFGTTTPAVFMFARAVVQQVVESIGIAPHRHPIFRQVIVVARLGRATSFAARRTLAG